MLFLSDEGPMLETLDYTIRIGSTPTFLYFDLYLYSAYAAHFVYLYSCMGTSLSADNEIINVVCCLGIIEIQTER